MTTTDARTATTGAHRPPDFVLLELPTDRRTREASPALLKLVARGVIRVLDLLVISKGEDGTFRILELSDPSGPIAGFEYFAGVRSGLLGDDDASEAASAMRPDTVAALIVYENNWGAPRRRSATPTWVPGQPSTR